MQQINPKYFTLFATQTFTDLHLWPEYFGEMKLKKCFSVQTQEGRSDGGHMTHL